MPIDEPNLYDAALIWPAAATHFLERPEDRRNGMLVIRVFLRGGKRGCYMMHGPKLHWESNPSDGGFGNTDQEGLWHSRERLGQVTVAARPTQLYEAFATYEAFLQAIGLLPE